MADVPDDDGQRVHLGGANAEFVRIRALAREQEPDFWDGNWMTCEVTLRFGGFQGPSKRTSGRRSSRSSTRSSRQYIRG